MKKSQKIIKLIEDIDLPSMGAEDLPTGYSIKFIGQSEGGGWELRLNGEFVDKFPTQRAAVSYACGRKEDKDSGWEE